MRLSLSSFVLILVGISILSISCAPKASQEAKDAFAGVIPKPVLVEPGDAMFPLTAETSVYADPSTEGVAELGDYVASTFGVTKSEGKTSENQIFLSVVSDSELGDEGYELQISPESISISANKPSGLFYGIQSLRQIAVKTEAGFEFASGKIRDYPNYAWRGSMLDVSRHFFGVDDIKRYIDLISHYKMNVLHLHLSDDQGWRIEIKSRPNLTAIGGKTQVGGNGGGFYTQEQYKELVAYGLARFVNIIPEVDLPGHTNAALASYPELNCDGKAPALYEGKEVGFSTLCRSTPEKEKITIAFLNDVIRELAELTPGPYIHIGGDEAAATKKEDYLEFVKIFKKIVQANGKQMVGWEEIAQSDIGPGDLAQYWHSKEYSGMAVQKGARIIMSPATKVYLDMKYDTAQKLGYTWAAIIDVDDAYNWKVEEMIPGVSSENVVGIEAPLWTETLTTMDEIEYMLFPRLPGVAEIAWSTGERSWDEYKLRLGRHGKQMEAMDINFYRSPVVDWK